MKQEKPKLVLSRLEDRSLEAYKEFIMGFCGEIGATAEDDSTEEEWIEDWKEYWAAVDAK